MKPTSSKPATCLIDGCGNKRVLRGLCQGCYTVARKSVERGRTTWQEIEELGLVLPKAQKTSRFMESLNARRAEVRTAASRKSGRQPKVVGTRRSA